MRIININGSFLIMHIEADIVTCRYFYPLNIFKWIFTKNVFELKDLTVKLIVQVYQDIQRDNDRKYRVD